MESYSGRLMEKVSPHGYVVTVEERDRHGHRWNVYSIIADSYMDLIAGIDSIQSSDDLNWGDFPNHETEDKLGRGLPSKSKGKWKAVLYSHRAKYHG